MMERQFHTPKGIIIRNLTQAETEDMAQMGDVECRKELFRQRFSKASDLQEKVDLIAEHLGLKT